MGQGPRYHVKFRRRREGKTDYRQRLALLKSGKPRLVVRRSNRNIICQFVTYHEDGDRVRAQADAQELEDLGWDGATGNTPTAYLSGLLAGQRALEQGHDEAVLDIGLQEPSDGGILFAALKGALDAGVEVPHGDGIFPGEDRLRGAHIGEDAEAAFDEVHEAIAGETPDPTDASDEEGS